ncbi:MAG: hypothetical protein MK209_03680 [Planctomycetes bacterium]|nr:hypothetical protein [Planctomycetota bacterium]
MSSPVPASPLKPLFQDFGAEFIKISGRELPLRVVGAGIEYQSARESLALADGSDRGLIRIQGADMIDFLQRTLSSDVSKLEVGGGQWSSLLDGKGRWISDLLLFRLPNVDGHPVILLDYPQDRASTLLQRIEMMHFGESLYFEELALARLLTLGPGSQALEFGVELAENLDEGCFWISRPDRGTLCRELIGPIDTVRANAEQLHADGAVPTGWVVLDILRVEAAQPRWGTDFDSESILPESGEWQRASLAKGCYAGQEVVAKVDTYGEAPRQLVCLDFGKNEEPLHGATLHDTESKAVGTVTSWVWSPMRNRAIGLGIVKRRALHDGSELHVFSGKEKLMISWIRPDKGPDRQRSTAQ